MIRIFHHSTASDILEIDDANDHWRPVVDDPDDPTFVGCASIAQRESESVRGSYTVENGRRCCLFWTDSLELVFMTHTGERLRLFRREADGLLTDLAPRMVVSLQSSTYADGRDMPGMSTFSLRDAATGTNHEVTYDAAAYIKQFGIASMLTYIPDEDLGDWDFFVGAKQALDELRLIARAGAVIDTRDTAGEAHAPDLLMADSGTACPRAGMWAPCRHNGMRSALAAGDVMPDRDGVATTWVWIGD